MFDFGIVEVRRAFPGDFGRDPASCVVLCPVSEETKISNVAFWPEGNVEPPRDGFDPWCRWEGDQLLVRVWPFYTPDESIGWHLDPRGFLCVP